MTSLLLFNPAKHWVGRGPLGPPARYLPGLIYGGSLESWSQWAPDGNLPLLVIGGSHFQAEDPGNV